MEHLRFRPFRSRLFTAMILASLVPMVICASLIVQVIRLQVDRTVQENTLEQSKNISQSFDTLHASLLSSNAQLQSDPMILYALQQEIGDKLKINSLLFNATQDARDYAVFDLYDLHGNLRFSTEDVSTSASLPTNWGILHSAAQAPGTAVYFSSENIADTAQPALTAAVQMTWSTVPFGYLVMRMYGTGFIRLLAGKYPQSDVLVLSRFFHPIFSSREELYFTLAPQLRQELLSSDSQELHSDEFHYTMVQHPETGLFFVIRQHQMFNRNTVQLLYTTGFICALIGISLSIMVSLMLARQISYPLERLQQAFTQLENDDLEVQLTVQGHDELSILSQRFNNTVSALKANREELLHNQQELKEAQLRMLQAQLNPHFLCNTLDTMKWISKINRVPQVALMSTNLADILRFCISSDEFVPLYREVDTLERYIEIQKIRLSDDFSFDLQIAEELYDCMVPKMILQPIVENAILHGINGMSESYIHVKAEPHAPGFFRITVADNGKGFPMEMLGRPYHRDKGLAKGHLGLYNVDTILMRYYGEECGLFLSRGENGLGASVTAVLPIVLEEETKC